MAEPIRGLRHWMIRLNEAELPAMAGIVQELLRVSDSQTASVRQLSDVLLRDASLTSQVLRISNSAFFNPRREAISTISRAIVVIGFEQVRMIGLSISLLDGLQRHGSGAQLLGLLARSFHASLQARTLAEQVSRRDKEQVFIATLLQHVGEMAFWSQDDRQIEALAERLAMPGVDRDRMVRDELGTSFRDLSLGLLKSWNMDEVHQLVNEYPALRAPAARCVDLGTRIANVLQQGWSDQARLAELQAEVAALTGLPEEEALVLLHDGSRQAAAVLRSSGNSQLAQLLPEPGEELQPLGVIGGARIEMQQALQPNPEFERLSLQNLELMCQAAVDVEAVLDALVNGLNKGSGLERVMLAVLADQQRRFRARRVAGEHTAAWLTAFDLPRVPQHPHIFDHVLGSQTPLWMGRAQSSSLDDLVTRETRQQVGEGMFLLAPLLAGKRQVGVLYADMRNTGRPLTDAQFVAFRQFARLAGECLLALGSRKR